MRAQYLDVRDARQSGPGSTGHGGCRQYSQQPYGDPGGRGLHVDPERDPGQDDDEDRRHVDLDQEEADVSSKVELHLLTCKVTCTAHKEQY